MTTEMISLKLDKNFLNDIDKIVEKDHYHNRTEFIREALRTKVKESAQDKKLWKQIEALRGSSKRKTTDEEYERAREQVSKELLQEFQE